jgi:hypothetical protein
MRQVCITLSDEPAISIFRVHTFQITGSHIPEGYNLNILFVRDEK